MTVNCQSGLWNSGCGAGSRTERHSQGSAQSLLSPQAFPSRAPWTIPPPHSTPASCTTSSWRPGAPCVKLTPRMTSPSFEFAPRKMKLWLHQVRGRSSPPQLESVPCSCREGFGYGCVHGFQRKAWRAEGTDLSVSLPGLSQLASPASPHSQWLKAVPVLSSGL